MALPRAAGDAVYIVAPFLVGVADRSAMLKGDREQMNSRVSWCFLNANGMWLCLFVCTVAMRCVGLRNKLLKCSKLPTSLSRSGSCRGVTFGIHSLSTHCR